MTVQRLPQDFSDWEGLLSLIQWAFAYMDGIIAPPSSAHRLTPALLAQKAKTETVFIAPPLSGCIFCRAEGTALYVGKLAVARANQGKGLGRSLMAAAEAQARLLGLPRLRLETRIELNANHTTFAAMGFIETARNAHAGYDRPTSITMEKLLSPEDNCQ